MFAEYLGNSVPQSSITDTGERFFYSVTTDSTRGAIYLKFVNASSAPQPVSIAFTRAPRIVKQGTLVTLSGTNATETNSITSPTRIVPAKTRFEDASAHFDHMVPPYSIQVLALSTR